MALDIQFGGLGNGFPFKVEHSVDGSDVGAGTLHPTGMTMHHACELWWKWKTYNIRIASDESGGIDFNEDHERFLYHDDISPIFPFEIAREIDLPLGACDEFLFFNNGIFINTSVYIITGAIGIFTLGNIGGATPDPDPLVKFWDGLYYPKIQFESNPGGLAFDSSTHSTYGMAIGDTQAVFNGKIIMQDGTEYDVPIWLSNFNSNPITPIAWELTCSEYFGYGGKFDTTTGARL